jgi:hypothetical protein
MDKVCDFIKSSCNNSNPNVYDLCQYIKINEDENISDLHLNDYVYSELKKNLGDDISNFTYEIVYDHLSFNFMYKDFDCNIWRKYNLKGHHYWIISV